MSHCRDFEEALWEAAEGRPLSAAAEAHLRSCESCRAAVRRLSAASDGFEALRAVGAPDPSAAVWQRLSRPRRRPAFALAWAAGGIVCIVAGTFALRHGPAPPPPAPVPPVQRIAKAPEAPPVARQVRPSAPLGRGASTEEIVRPAELHVGTPGRTAGGRGRVASARQQTHAAVKQQKQQPETPAQTLLVEAPPGDGAIAVQADASTPYSKAVALTYRAIGRALVARFLADRNETG